MTSPSSTSKMPPWSYTALTAFETCPRRYYLTRVAKQVTEPPTEATIWGNRVHTAIEHRLQSKAPLPDYLSTYEPMIAALVKKNGKKIIEERFTLDKNFRPTTWTAPTAWCRGVVDAGIVGSKNAVILDWKTGKRKPDSSQLKLFAALTFAHYPWVERVATGFVWLKENSLDQEVFTRSQIPEIWQEFVQRVRRLEIAYADQKWQASPSGLCAKWCPCTSCEFCGAR